MKKLVVIRKAVMPIKCSRSTSEKEEEKANHLKRFIGKHDVSANKRIKITNIVQEKMNTVKPHTQRKRSIGRKTKKRNTQNNNNKIKWEIRKQLAVNSKHFFRVIYVYIG